MNASAPLTGADAFLRSVERMMERAGQGQHLGLSVLELGPGFDPERFRGAARRLAEASPIAAARIRQPLFQVARWSWDAADKAAFLLREHPAGTDLEALCQRRLNEPAASAVTFDLVPRAGGGASLVMCWRHLLLDGKGAELLLAELGRLAEDPAAATRPRSWGVLGDRKLSWRALLAEAGRFKDGFYENTRHAIRALAPPRPGRAGARFLIEAFSVEETARINARAEGISRGLFHLGWFLAAAMRAHRAVWLRRGAEPASYQVGCAVGERKRGARHPIWQNQVSQLFFRLLPAEAASLEGAAARLQEQFATLSRQRMDTAFAAMTGLLRRLPPSWYLRLLRANSGGYLTSFFFSHTGAFLPECDAFCGAPILNGWHVPSICAPPGTGLFFSERNGALTATFSWRDGAVAEEELALMRATLREDLLGP